MFFSDGVHVIVVAPAVVTVSPVIHAIVALLPALLADVVVVVSGRVSFGEGFRDPLGVGALAAARGGVNI